MFLQPREVSSGITMAKLSVYLISILLWLRCSRRIYIMLMMNRRRSWWRRMAREILGIGSTLFGILGGNSGTCTSSSRDLTDSLVF